ncbi:ABC transporter permease [Pusillimonas caeni]|uniref:ABC transporter permease n=1 Tax=Pusillimonas caeni TaxID=1348472 RepID=UPI000E59E672|nr:ABC transporter permease [Pusillimonas caeni]TFL14396.1 ABC transporter permease [Pusillimonas caeni]
MEILALFWNLVPVTLVQGLIYSLIALAIMIPFRVLSVPDLSSEGVFPLGAAVATAFITWGVHPLLATLAAVAAGFLAGMTTALIHLKFKVHSLLAGILTVTMLWSVNLRILDKPNLPLFGFETLYDWVDAAIVSSMGLQIVFFGVLVLVLILGLWWMLQTDMGLGLRGIGANPHLAPALGVSLVAYTAGGLGLASAISGLAGALMAQLQGYADVGMGLGMLVNGLASLIIGEAVMGRGTLLRQIAAPVVGALIYYQLSSLALALGLDPSDLKLVTGLFVLFTIGWPYLFGRKVSGTGL